VGKCLARGKQWRGGVSIELEHCVEKVGEVASTFVRILGKGIKDKDKCICKTKLAHSGSVGIFMMLLGMFGISHAAYRGPRVSLSIKQRLRICALDRYLHREESGSPEVRDAIRYA